MSPRTKNAYGQMRDERITEILTVASKIFAIKGYSATMMEDITTAANISKGLIYHYFDSKDELFAAAVQRSMEGALALLNAALAQPGTPWERLHWLTGEVITRTSKEPQDFMIIVQSYTTESVPENVHAMSMNYTNTTTQVIRGLIIEGQASNQVIGGDPDKLATTFAACLQGLALSAATRLRQASDLPDIETALRILKA